MPALDIWLDGLETDKTMPRFCQEPQPYDIATLASVNWRQTPTIDRRLVQDADSSVRASPENNQFFPAILSLLLQYDQKGLIIACYDLLLSRPGSGRDGLGTSSVEIDVMLDFLRDAPFLAVRFAGLDSWGSKTTAGTVTLTLQNCGSEVLHAFIAFACAAGSLVVGPFQTILRSLQDLSLDRLAMLTGLLILVLQNAIPDDCHGAHA